MDLDTVIPVGSSLCRVFGVRHLSPAAAHHLEAVLDALKPTAVLVEGPADASAQIKHLVHKETKPPLAILAYTKARPVRTILYPLAEYSPEWVALTWGVRHKTDTRFIDLPASVFLQLHDLAKASRERDRPEDEPEPPVAGAPQTPVADAPGSPTKKKPSEHTLAYLDDPHEAIARLSGDPDHETWWERHFEHTTAPAAYAGQIVEFGRGLRELRPGDEENEAREAFMRRCIHDVLKKHKPEKVLVVCGAFHCAGLGRDLPPMSDEQFKALPQVECSLTLMPYSYYRLSSQSGYGAGNHAPWYFQRIFEERHNGASEKLPARFLTELVHVMRRAGQVRSAAEVIEGVRLAQSLAALAGSSAPCLRDLRDAAVTCLGRGEAALIAPHLTEVEVGASIGKLPKGVGQTAIQDDFYLTLGALKLERFQVDKNQDLELDLRENRFVKGESAAFRDLNISTFLHRLKSLGVEFGTQAERRQEGTAKEKWTLRWRPECEIQLVEAALKGDSVEVAAAVALSERLAACQTVDEAGSLVHDAATCQLADALEDARQRLQAMAVDATNVPALAKALDQLEEVIGFGTVRKVDPEPLKPLLAQLFLRATLSAKPACACDRKAASDLGKALQVLHKIAGGRLAGDLVDAERWYAELAAIAAADNLNSYLSGLACSMLLEVNRLSEEELAREVSRRLSPGIDAELGAGWFEGLVQYNRFGLFGRLALWRQLDAYIVSLDDDAFRKALVYLRRAFSSFEAGEIRRVVTNLVTISQDSAEELKANVDAKLSEEEAAKLSEALGDLSF